MRFKSIVISALFAGLVGGGHGVARADVKFLTEAAQKAAAGKYDQAIEQLAGKKDEEFSGSELAQKYFALGVWSVELKKHDEARAYLEKALELKTINKAYAYFLIGHTYKEQGKYKEAVQYLNKTLDAKPPMNIHFQARLDFADMSVNLGQYAKAVHHLSYLERRWRGDYRHPEIVWRLIGAELKRERRWQACRWARRMYSRYPGHPLVADWGVDLHTNKYDGVATGCLASNKELKQRIRQLQLAAQDDKALKEIEELAKRSSPSQQFEIDLMRAEFLQWQGYVDEALAILVKYYEQQRSNFNYLMLVGKVAARAGEHQTAVGAYVRAHEISPRSRSGRNALFSAAFLSYQFQDYDGANRKFQEFARRYGRSGLSRDARWHMAWIKYLKGNYAGAKKEFRELVVQYRGRGRRRRAIRDDRVRYWLAMTELKQENLGEARELFTQLSKVGKDSYYGMLASYRLSQLPPPVLRQLTAEEPRPEADASPVEMTSMPVPPVPNSTATSPEEAGAAARSEELESEEEMETVENASEEESAEAEVADADESGDASNDAESPEEAVAQTSFKDPRLQERFDRANILIRLGLNDWARWELYEIERRTSNKTYLRMLMDAYKKIGSYNRSSYISEIYFSAERNGDIDKNNRAFWESSYPKAFAEVVDRSAGQFGIDAALVYAIMRAESHFNKDAISPVGARGLMQVMPYTAERLAKLLGDSDYTDAKLIEPSTNIRFGARYLSRLSRKFSSQVPLIAAGYNAGPHRVYSWLSSFGHLSMDEFIEHVPFVETRNYIKKVVKNFAVYKSLYSAPNISLAFLTEPIPVKVNGRPSPRENWEVLD